MLRVIFMYQTKLNLLDTEIALKKVKDLFERELAFALNLTRVSAPIIVYANSGLNDNLNGYERPVSFSSPNYDNDIEIVQSLAKWKRMALAHYGFKPGTGLYTDMNAIRRDEFPDHLHSIYVDQWDWEKIITKENRNQAYLKEVVEIIVHTLHLVQNEITSLYPILDKYVNEDVHFVTTSKLEQLYPSLTPKERENAITRKYKTVFVSQIGWPLTNNKPHDGRAPDYDDWLLNGDLLIYHPLLDEAIEISSMGIRVDKDSLMKQLVYKNDLAKLEYNYHKAKDVAKREKKIIVVEGFMDAIRISSIGIKNVIALQGTAMTMDQIQLLKKLRVKVILCLDNDNAGLIATVNNGDELVKNEVETEVIRLSGAKDPDEYILANGGESFKENVEHPLTYFEFKMNYLKQNY